MASSVDDFARLHRRKDNMKLVIRALRKMNRDWFSHMAQVKKGRINECLNNLANDPPNDPADTTKLQQDFRSKRAKWTDFEAKIAKQSEWSKAFEHDYLEKRQIPFSDPQIWQWMKMAEKELLKKCHGYLKTRNRCLEIDATEGRWYFEKSDHMRAWMYDSLEEIVIATKLVVDDTLRAKLFKETFTA